MKIQEEACEFSLGKENIMADVNESISLVERISGRSKRYGRSMGALLIDSGKISATDAEKIINLQNEQGLMFGDAAKKLGFITDRDIDEVLSLQFDYPYAQSGKSSVSPEVVAAYNPFSSEVEALRALRTQLMLRWFDGKEKQRSIAITSPMKHEGRSWLTANLGVVFSQLGAKTIIIDGDLRKPKQHSLLGVSGSPGLSTYLSERASEPPIHRVEGFHDLSILPAGAIPPNPQELLAKPNFSTLLRSIEAQFDIVLIDTAPGTRYADAQSIAARVGGALVVVKKNETKLKLARTYINLLNQAHVHVVGTVLNEG